MMDAFLFVGLPYLSLLIFIIGCVWRARREKFTLSARSSQFLEDRQLLLGSTPWHIGIGVVLLGHVVAGFLPKVWASILSVPGALLAVETAGVACSLLAIIGLGVLLGRRLTSGKIQAVTTPADLIVLGLLLAQVGVGLLSAIHYRYGSVWSTGTVVPYFWSLMTLQPDMAYVAGFPPLFKLHLTLAWIIVLLVPFTRLIHLLALPLQYLWRAPLLIVWNTTRRRREAVEAVARAESRREFLKGAAGVAGAGGLLALGVMEKGVNYFRGPRLEPDAEAELLTKKLQRLQQTAHERELELERQRQDMILVARYSELTENKGKYFIDYSMAPALAFKDKDGLPLLISAKCTHLGCTVGSEVDNQGRLLCPCHVSYFDLRTGRPNEGAPAKAPLPHLGWALVDASGKVVARKPPLGPVEGAVDAVTLAQCSVYIVKPRPASV